MPSSTALYTQSLAKLQKQVHQLHTKPLDAIEVLPSSDDLTIVYAILDGPSNTPFEGGKFKIKLVYGADFPDNPPKGFFITKIFHPNVAPSTGEICVNTLKKDWKKDLPLEHILLTIKSLLIYPNPESALNADAGRYLLESFVDYEKHARLMTKIHAQGSAPSSRNVSNASSAAAAALSRTSSKSSLGSEKMPLRIGSGNESREKIVGLKKDAKRDKKRL